MVSALGVPSNRRFPGALLLSLLPILFAIIWAPRLASAQEIESPDLAAMVQSIVGVKAIVPSNARTAESLGTERMGSGVVIDSSGLIVTIGYLVMEASSVEVRTMDGKAYPADIVAYDQASGFGLLRGQYGFKAKPMRLRPVGGGQGRRSPAGAQLWRAGGVCAPRSWSPSANSRLLGVSAGRGAVHVAAHHGFRRGGPGVAHGRVDRNRLAVRPRCGTAAVRSRQYVHPG